MKKWGAPLAALLMAIGVAIGAFGAHGLQQWVERGDLQPRDLEIFRTGVSYHLIHGVAMLIAALLARRQVWGASLATLLFLVGIVLFSGSLYTLVLTGIRKWGGVTPLGGLSFIVAWLLLSVALARNNGEVDADKSAAFDIEPSSSGGN